GHFRVAVAGAELQLVGEAPGVEEVAGVELVLLLRPLGLVELERVVPDTAGVDEGGLVQPALGDELETAVDLGVQAGQVEVRGEDVGVLDLVRGRLGTEVPLVVSGFLGTGGTGVAADLDLVAVEV